LACIELYEACEAAKEAGLIVTLELVTHGMGAGKNDERNSHHVYPKVVRPVMLDDDSY